MEINGVSLAARASATEVAADVCGKLGHNIALFERLGKYGKDFLCTKCGLMLDEIRCKETEKAQGA